MTILVLHTADTHLGYRQYGLHERELDIYKVFDEIVDIALREHVDAVLHSGDLFDTSRPPPQAIRAAIHGLRRLRDNGIPFITILGDHDLPRRRALPPQAILDDLGLSTTLGLRGGAEKRRIRTRSGAVLEAAGVTATRGPDARRRLAERLARLRPAGDAASVLLLHQSLQEAAPEHETSLGELPRGYSYYALGHIHLHREWRLGDSVVAYPGSPEALRLDEARQQEKRLVLLAELAPGATRTVQQVALRSPRPQLVVELSYEGLDKLRARLAELRGKLAAYPQKPLLHLRVTNVPRREKKSIYKLLESLLDRVVLSYRAYIDTVEEELPRSLQAPSEINLPKMMEELLRDKELAELAQKILDAVTASEKKVDAEREILRILAEHYGVNP